MFPARVFCSKRASSKRGKLHEGKTKLKSGKKRPQQLSSSYCAARKQTSGPFLRLRRHPHHTRPAAGGVESDAETLLSHPTNPVSWLALTENFSQPPPPPPPWRARFLRHIPRGRAEGNFAKLACAHDSNTHTQKQACMSFWSFFHAQRVLLLGGCHVAVCDHVWSAANFEPRRRESVFGQQGKANLKPKQNSAIEQTRQTQSEGKSPLFWGVKSQRAVQIRDRRKTTNRVNAFLYEIILTFLVVK